MKKCNECVSSVVNGVSVHEVGCPDYEINLSTGKYCEKECQMCGTSYIPDNKHQKCCSFDCFQDFFGVDD